MCSAGGGATSPTCDGVRYLSPGLESGFEVTCTVSNGLVTFNP
jgi:hypothetical protein